MVSSKKDFALSDLESGMVMETRNGQMWLVIGQTACNYHDGCIEWLDFNLGFDNGGLCANLPKFDVVAFYGRKYGNALKHYLNKEYGELIWQREPEIKEVTLDEVAKKFGVEVNRLRIKK